MAFLVKPHNKPRAGYDLVRTWQRTDRADKALPASTNEALFTVSGGRVIVHRLLGEVGTAIQNQVNLTSITTTPTAGTAGTVASNLDIANDEAGTLYFPEGDGTALVGVNAGTGFTAGNVQSFIVPIGTIRLACSATNTGSIKWSIWWEPLDNNATLVAA